MSELHQQKVRTPINNLKSKTGTQNPKPPNPKPKTQETPEVLLEPTALGSGRSSVFARMDGGRGR